MVFSFSRWHWKQQLHHLLPIPKLFEILLSNSYNSPELVHRFHHDSSVISRPDTNGLMTSVTTMQGINEKILPLDSTNHKAEINTADAQKSYKEGMVNPWRNIKVNGVHDAPIVPSTPEPDPAPALVGGNQNVAEQVYEPSDQERSLVTEKEAVLESQFHSSGDDIPIVVESASSSAQEDTLKKSYASIVSV
ncbi:hypothetical protein PTKIN_Ptkin08bG0068400 [Pterospermum kingtungense]